MAPLDDFLTVKLAKRDDYDRTTSILTEPECRWQQTFIASIPGMTGLAHDSDVAVLKNQALSMFGSQDGGIDHSPGEAVGPNH